MSSQSTCVYRQVDEYRITPGLDATIRTSQILYPTNTRVTIRVNIPQRISVLTKPSIWLTLQNRIVRFVYYFIPLYLAVLWLLDTVYSSKQVKARQTSDFPEQLVKPELVY